MVISLAAIWLLTDSLSKEEAVLLVFWWIRNFSEEELDSSPDGCFYRLNPRSYSWVREEKKRKVKVRQKMREEM